jgi:hypothetical protein
MIDHLPTKHLQVEELRDDINLEGFKFEPSNKVLVIWEWKWTDQDNTDDNDHDASNDEEITAIPETPPAVSDEKDRGRRGIGRRL